MTSKIVLTGNETITLNDLYTQALGIKARCKDINIDMFSSSRIEHSEDYGILNVLAPLGEVSLAESSANEPTVLGCIRAKLTLWSFRQLCSGRLKIPYTYMKNLIDSKALPVQALFEKNVNTHIAEYHNGLRIRLYRGDDGLRVRGILTPAYTVFDTDKVLETVMSVVKQYEGIGFKIKGHFIDETGIQVRMISDEPLDVEGEEGDLFAGVLIQSGDVGNRKLSVQFFIWKQICANGLVVAKGSGEMLHKRHRGACEGDFYESLVAAMSALPTFAKNATEIIRTSKGEKLDEKNMKELLDRFTPVFKVTDEERELIVSLANERYDTSKWGIVNAITEFAQAERFDIDTRTEIETYAGSIIFNPKVLNGMFKSKAA